MKYRLNQWNQILNNPWIEWMLFTVLFWFLLVFLQLNRHFDDMIIGPHYWRKSDTYAQIMNYYYNQLHFFDHGIYYNQMDSNGKAVAEFPLFYYWVAIQFKLFGPSIWLGRINWLLVNYAGMFFSFKLSKGFLKNTFLAFTVTLSFFLSPIFTFYSFDFLPDPLALNFALIGLYFLWKSQIYSTKKWLWLTLIFISFAGMIKPFFLIPYLAFLSTLIVNQWFKFSAQLKWKWGYFIPLIMVVIWFVYTHWYNQHVGSNYFLSEWRPIWKYSIAENNKTWHQISERWFPEYLNPYFLWVFLGLILTNIFFIFRFKKILNLFYGFSLLGVISFVLLFFNMLKHHDYYIFPILFFVPLSVLVFFNHLKDIKLTSTYISYASIFIFSLAVLGTNYSWELNQNRRKTAWINSQSEFENYIGLEKFMLKNGIKLDTKVIAFSDKSPSYALLLLNRQGWSGFQTKAWKWDLPFLIDQGAEVVIFNDRAAQLNDSIFVKGFLNYPIADTNGVYFYNLKPYQP